MELQSKEDSHHESTSSHYLDMEDSTHTLGIPDMKSTHHEVKNTEEGMSIETLMKGMFTHHC